MAKLLGVVSPEFSSSQMSHLLGGGHGDQMQAFAAGSPTPKLVLGYEVPARQEQGDSEHQPSCRIEQHIAQYAMGDGKRCVDQKPTGQ